LLLGMILGGWFYKMGAKYLTDDTDFGTAIESRMVSQIILLIAGTLLFYGKKTCRTEISNPGIQVNISAIVSSEIRFFPIVQCQNTFILLSSQPRKNYSPRVHRANVEMTGKHE
jgi:hypothetical protein